MADNDVKIQITTVADTAGAKAAASALGEVNNASVRGSEVGRNLTSALKDQERATKSTSEQTLKGAEAFEKINNAARGGAAGILNIIPALKGLGAAFLANPITAGLAIFLALKDYAAAAGRAFGGLLVDARKLADGLSGTGNNAKIVAENLGAVQEAGENALVKIKDDAKAAADDIERFYRGVDEAKKRLDTLADSALAAKLAELDLAEAQALANATTEEQRVGIKQSFDGQRTTARREAEASSQEREKRFETERLAGGRESVTAAQGRIDSAQAAYNTRASVLADQLEKNKGLSSTTPEGAEALRLTAIARAEAEAAAQALAAAKAANDPIITKGREQVRQAETALTVLGNRETASAATAAAQDLTITPKRAAEIEAARAADAQAATLATIPTTAGGLQGIAQTAAASPALFDAAKALNDAAAAAKESGTTPEEAKALVDAANAFAAAAAQQKIESAALKAAIAQLTAQVKGLRN